MSMPDLPHIYDDVFFQEWGRDHEKYIRSAEILTDLISEHLKPKSLIDIGCGCGVYSYYFQKKKMRVVALDGVQPPEVSSYPVTMEIRDLTIPFKNVWGNFDVAMCLEVAEHIPEKLRDAFLENITQFSDCLILSAAPPKQGGHHHVNEQPKRYWVGHLARYNYVYNRKKTGQLLEKIKEKTLPYMWMGEQISIYEKPIESDLKRELPFGKRLGEKS